MDKIIEGNQVNECYFTIDKTKTSATICANCGNEKYLHTIGEGVNITTVIIYNTQNKLIMEDKIIEGNAPIVALCWATKKRHIAVNGVVLCEPSHVSNGYSVKNGGYNSLQLSGIPNYKKICDDTKHSHGDGFIKFLPMQDQDVFIDTRSICTKCLKKYNKILNTQTK